MVKIHPVPGKSRTRTIPLFAAALRRQTPAMILEINQDAGRGPPSNLETAPFYEIRAMAGEKLVKHPGTLPGAVSCLGVLAYIRIPSRLHFHAHETASRQPYRRYAEDLTNGACKHIERSGRSRQPVATGTDMASRGPATR
jgi:hypothetical protein